MPSQGRKKASSARSVRRKSSAIRPKAHLRRSCFPHRRILADDVLRPIFDGNESLSMFEVTAFISRHLQKT